MAFTKPIIMNAAASSPKYSRLALAGWLAICFAASITAVFVSTTGWYAGLQKPAWNPPAWIFGPVWTLLYLLMAIAAWMVWREGGWRIQRRPLGLFLFQWLLNAMWTPLFFWPSSSRSGLRRDYFTLVGAGGNAGGILASAAGRRCFVGALSGLGDICGSAEFHHLAS
jgi:hypothetical protein